MNVSVRDFVLFIHIAAAAVLVGSSAMTPFFGRKIGAAATRAELLGWLSSLRLLTRANPFVALVLLLSGIYLGSAGWWTQGWFAVSVAAWILSAGLAGGVIKPAMMRMGMMAGADPAAPIDGALDQLRHARGWHVAEAMLLASDAAILWIMIAKPDLAPSIAILAVTMALFAGSALLPWKAAATA